MNSSITPRRVSWIGETLTCDVVTLLDCLGTAARTTRCDRRRGSVRVVWGVVPFVVAGLVELPVRIDVAARSQCPQPSGPPRRQRAPVSPSGRGPRAGRRVRSPRWRWVARREVAVVVQIRRIFEPAVGAGVDRLAGGGRQAGDGRRTAHRRGHRAGPALENAPHARPCPARQ